MPRFDATISIGFHHIGSREPTEAVAAVHQAVADIPGAECVDVEYTNVCPKSWGAAAVRPAGSRNIPNTPEWRRLKDYVEEVVLAAAKAANDEAAASSANRASQRASPLSK
jgi:hypothetical protein